MFKAEGDILKVTRANAGIIDFDIPGYTFQKGDTLEFRIYKEEGLNEPPLKTKEITVQEECTSVEIPLTCEDTNIGEPANEMIVYWYEIELNDEDTNMGYDENGPKILQLYPKGVENNDTHES